MTPLAKWVEEIEHRAARRLPPHSSLTQLVGQTDTRTLSRSTIRMFGMAYHSPRLTEYANRHNEKEEVTVRFDPEDISKVWVIDYEDGVAIEAQCKGRMMRDYTGGLSLHAHHVVRNHVLRGRPKDEGKIMLSELLAAKAELAEYADAMLGRKRNRGMNTRLARFMDGWSKHYQPEEPVEYHDEDAAEYILDDTFGSDPIDVERTGKSRETISRPPP